MNLLWNYLTLLFSKKKHFCRRSLQTTHAGPCKELAREAAVVPLLDGWCIVRQVALSIPARCKLPASGKTVSRIGKLSVCPSVCIPFCCAAFLSLYRRKDGTWHVSVRPHISPRTKEIKGLTHARLYATDSLLNAFEARPIRLTISGVERSAECISLPRYVKRSVESYSMTCRLQ